MKRILQVLLIVLLVGAGFAYGIFFGDATGFGGKTQGFVIEEGATGRQAVLKAMEDNKVITNPTAFSLLFGTISSWEKIRPGKYEVKKGQSLVSIARMLKNGQLAQYKLVINKLRLKEDLARLISRNLAPDSVSVMSYLNSNDSLEKFGVDTSQVFTLIIPDTYSFYWNTSITKILQRLATAKDGFWKKNGRIEKAKKHGLSTQQAYILASIVEEETNYDSDKYKIASVYLNRLDKRMPLQACPTIKYAMKNFALTRIYEKYLSNPSPYNTYHKPGLPPGPICTPSPKTIDIILDAPETDYLFFVAKSDFSGYHHFSSNFSEHNQYAKEYQKQLDIYMARKKQNPVP